MAQHIITVSDIDGGISLRVEGTDQVTPAGSVARAMVKLAEQVVAKVNQAAAKGCNCQQCQARREAEAKASPTESKPTLH